MSGLHRRIFLHFLGVLAVVGVASSIVFALGARDAFLREVVERTTLHVAALVGEALGDQRALEDRLEQLHRDLDVDVTVRDLDGRILAAIGPVLPQLSPTDAAEARNGVVISRARPRHAVALVRDAQSGAPRAALAISAPRRVRFGGLLRPALGVAVVLLIVGLATVPLAHRISRPIERLTEGARRFGRGDLGYRVPPDAPRRSWRRGRRDRPPRRRHADPLDELTRAFNEMAERVERIVHSQKELLANVSHELRSPLTRIRMALELLPLDASSAPRVAALERDLDELDRLIEDVLTSTRLDTTGLPTELGVVDGRALLDELAERARQDPAVSGLAMRVEAQPFTLVADAALLRRALWNLIENAVKYGAPPITLAGTRENSTVILSVTDDGPGIPSADRERVFTPFFQGDRARTPSATGDRPRGVGLGLTLARSVAEVHGGAIAVEPAAVADGRERGCRVVMRIPAERA